MGRGLGTDGGSAHAFRAGVSGFTAEWLALREPADIAARSAAGTSFVTGALAQHSSLHIVDLGSGTGSNVRYLSRHLPQGQRWQLVDNDAMLLEAARSLLSIDVETSVADLRHLDASVFTAAELVTASALLDLVSESWLRTFVRHCYRGRVAVLAALNYDGRIVCSPADKDDDLVRDLVNQHQRTDKGFGPALGFRLGLGGFACIGNGGQRRYRLRRFRKRGCRRRESPIA